MKRIVLCDINKKMIEEWKKVFNGCDNVTVTNEDIFKTGTDAIISPANSRGIMRGGFDFYLAKHFGKYTELVVQNAIIAEYGKCFLPIGEVLPIRFISGSFNYLIVAPTMENPGMNISKTDNVYKASLAIFKLLKESDEINSITLMGLGTGVGGVKEEQCAKDMYKAYVKVFNIS